MLPNELENVRDALLAEPRFSGLLKMLPHFDVNRLKIVSADIAEGYIEKLTGL